ncbi:unnamed protein product, partial [Cladocopium goreaui]
AMTGSQPKDSKGRRDGTFSSLLSAVRAQSGEGAGLRKSGAVTAGPQKWQGKMQEPQVQGTRSGYLHPRVHEGGHAFFGSKAVPEKLPDMDNEGRPFNLKLVVVNFNNAVTLEPKKLRHLKVKELTKSKYKVIGVIYQNWEAWDGDEWCQGIPEESGRTLLSADDEMTIKCAYHRNCCILDNDNYKDWLHLLRKDEIREWYQFSRGRIHMKYFFDSVGFFETLDGNAVRGASEEREEREEKRKSRNRSRARVEEEARNQRYSEDAWSAPSGIDNTPPETAESSMLSDPVGLRYAQQHNRAKFNLWGAHPLFYALCNWSEKGESLKAYAERKVGQAAEMKRFGAAYFASASRQDALPQIIVEALTSE